MGALLQSTLSARKVVLARGSWFASRCYVWEEGFESFEILICFAIKPRMRVFDTEPLLVRPRSRGTDA